MEIVSISDENCQIFDVLSQNYEAEFSAITKKEPDAKGLFTLDSHWKEPNHGFFLFLDEKPAGFAIVGKENVWDITEFYILPCYRNKGLGKQFAFTIFDSFPGSWQVRQILIATDAIAFWRSTIREYTNAQYIEDQVKDPTWGEVICQTFTSRRK